MKNKKGKIKVLEGNVFFFKFLCKLCNDGHEIFIYYYIFSNNFREDKLF